MATLEEILSLLQEINNRIELLPQETRITARQIVLNGGLSELSTSLGLISAGEFRSHADPLDPKTPGDGFSGLRIKGSGMSYGSDNYNIAGVDADVLQSGMTTDGKFIAGAGAVKLDADGVSIVEPSTYGSTSSYKFLDGADIPAIFYSYKDVIANRVYAYIKSVGNSNEEEAVLELQANGYSLGSTFITLSNTVAGGQSIILSADTLRIGDTGGTLDSNGILYDSTYTPTLYNTTNIAASTAQLMHYQRIGNQVNVWGDVMADPTTGGDCVLGISLPIASGLTALSDLAGTGSMFTTGVPNESTIIAPDIANDRAAMYWFAVNTANKRFRIHFSYEIA